MTLHVLMFVILLGLHNLSLAEKTIGSDHSEDRSVATSEEDRQHLNFLSALQHDIARTNGNIVTIDKVLNRYAAAIESVITKFPRWQQAIPFEMVMNSRSHYLVSATSNDYLSVFFLAEYPGMNRELKLIEPLSLPRAFTFNMKTHQRVAIAHLFENWRIARQPFMKLLADYAKQQYCTEPTLTKMLRAINGREQNFYITAGGLHILSGVQGTNPFTCDSELYVPKEALLKIGIHPNIWHPALFEPRRHE